VSAVVEMSQEERSQLLSAREMLSGVDDLRAVCDMLVSGAIPDDADSVRFVVIRLQAAHAEAIASASRLRKDEDAAAALERRRTVETEREDARVDRVVSEVRATEQERRAQFAAVALRVAERIVVQS
jgi:hypothetical protein